MIALLHPGSPKDRSRYPGALIVSTVAHAAAILGVLWVTTLRPSEPGKATARVEQPERIVWVAMPGPSGGGGGSKAPVPAPPKPVPPPQAATVEQPAPQPIPVEEPVALAEPQEPAPDVPAPIASAATPGAATAPAPTLGNGTGGGSGDGQGAGAGPGRDGGFGGGALRPGNGVTTPIPITRGTPSYTAQAMRARAQGIMTVECVVEPNGQCGEIRLVAGFTPPHGLDEQALLAARRWRFRPGMRGGEPVPVLVSLEIEFNIR